MTITSCKANGEGLGWCVKREENHGSTTIGSIHMSQCWKVWIHIKKIIILRSMNIWDMKPNILGFNRTQENDWLELKFWSSQEFSKDKRWWWVLKPQPINCNHLCSHCFTWRDETLEHLFKCINLLMKIFLFIYISFSHFNIYACINKCKRI